MTWIMRDNTPGLRPAQIFESLDDGQAERILPRGVFHLIRTLAPERLNGENRADILGQMLSVETIIDDPQKRSILLSAVPEEKINELENRAGMSMDSLRQKEEIETSLRLKLSGFFGSAATADPPMRTTGSLRSVTPERGLFPHQKQVASEIERHLYGVDSRVMLHLPTGVGKTRTAMSIVASHLRSRRSGLALWLAATGELLEQAADEFESTWRAVGDRPVDCVRFWATHDPPLDQVEDGIIIAGLGKMHSYGKTRKDIWDLGDRITMVIFDEAHQAVADTYQDIVETIVTRNPRTPLLGLSATPGRTWEKPEIDAAVAELFRENKVMLDFGDVNPIQHLTDEGYLASVDFSLLNSEPGLRLSDADLADIAKSLDIPAALAAQLGEDEQRNLRIVQKLLELAEKHSRILVFAASVDNALLLASVCRGVGLAADAVTAKTDAIQRKHAIQRFKRRGKPARILINYGVLTTGFDAPAASAALIARPTRSLVLYSQMVGRVIRGPKAGGNERCEVITVVDATLPGFGDIAEAFTNWEDVWNAN